MLRSWKQVGVAAVLPALGLCGCDVGSRHEPELELRVAIGSAEGTGDAPGAADSRGVNGDVPGRGGNQAPSAIEPGGIGAGGANAGLSGSGGGGNGSGNGGAGGTGGNGGTGGGPSSPPANDTCPGQPVGIDAGFAVHIDGSLGDAADDLTTFCSDTSLGSGNPDVVYQLDVAADVSASIELSSAAFDPVLSLRLLTCTWEFGGDACLHFGSGTQSARVSLPAGTYWIVVDSADGKSGEFTLDVRADAPVCGDGVLNAGEQCDPGAAAADDGCFDPETASECTFGEAPIDAGITACPGFGPVAVGLSADPASPTVTRLGPHNNGSGAHAQINDLTADPNVCGSPAVGPENVFHVVPTSSGTLHARIGHDGVGAVVCDTGPVCGDFIMYARQGSCEAVVPADATQQLGCVDVDAGFQEVLELEMPVNAGEDYWMFVDGLDDTWGIGPYHLELWLL